MFARSINRLSIDEKAYSFFCIFFSLFRWKQEGSDNAD
jgi:hypothetical protein